MRHSGRCGGAFKLCECDLLIVEQSRDPNHRPTRAALHESCAMQDRFKVLSSKSASEKTAAFLLTMADRAGQAPSQGIAVDLPMYCLGFTASLGLTTQTACQIFTRFRAEVTGAP
jgi:CRP-like cAMP-binding protein